MESILILADRAGSSETIAFVHETNAYKHDALTAFDWVKKRFGQRRVLTLSFGSKEEFMPLQAADILAYEGNKRLRDPKRPERRPWTVLSAPRQGRPRLWALHYGKTNMHRLVESMRRVRESIDRGETTFILDSGGVMKPRGQTD